MSAVDKQYGWTVLGTGLRRMWRGVVPLVLVVLVNAVVQASVSQFPSWLALGVSAAVLLCSFAFTAHLAYRSVAGRSRMGDLVTADLARFSLWIVAWTIVVSAGLALYFWPGVFLLAVTPFLPVAAAAGVGNPLGANFVAIRSRPGRWLVTVLVSLLVILVVWLLAALNAFFVQGWVAAFTTWLVIGLVAAWLLTAWSALFRSTPAAGS